MGIFRLFFRRVRKKPSKVATKHFLKHKEAARAMIHARLAYFAPLCEVKYGRVAIRNQRRRWGSCSSLGNLNFNYRLVFLPSELCDYVVVHELCHLKQMNHGPLFWAEVGKVLPNYLELEAQLKHLEKNGATKTDVVQSAPVAEVANSATETEID